MQKETSEKTVWTLNKFQIVRKIGSGRLSEVYLAALVEDIHSEFVLKKCLLGDRGAHERSLVNGEVSIHSAVHQHPHVLKVYGSFDDEYITRGSC